MTDRPVMRELHPASGLRPGAWYACQEPDRAPQVDLTAFEKRCPDCNRILERVRALTEAAGIDPATLVMTQRTPTGVELPVGVKVDDRLRHARRRRSEPPPPHE